MSKGNKISLAQGIEIARCLKIKLKPFGVVIGGSIRRRKPMVGDIDAAVLVLEEQANAFDMLLIRNFGSCKTDQMRGLRNFMFLGRQVNLIDAPYRCFGAAVLMSTGSGRFNVRMRSVAKSFGWKLSQYGLMDRFGNLLAGESEEEIFEALDMEYLEPWEREIE